MASGASNGAYVPLDIRLSGPWNVTPSRQNIIASTTRKRTSSRAMCGVWTRELQGVDALWASPPCQSHSQARQKNAHERDDAWIGLDILRYVGELLPPIVMIENVPGYRKHPACKEIVDGLAALGYTVDARVLNCADYGIPQTRERLIVQARRDGRIAWPQPSNRRVGWHEAIKDILPPPDKPLSPWQARRWSTAYDNLCAVILRGQFVFDDTSPLRCDRPDEPSSTVLSSDHCAKYIVYPVLNDTQWRYDEQGMRLFPTNVPATTITSSDGSQKDIIYPDRTPPMRARMTARCAARLQTLPDEAIWPKAYYQAIQLIGNAVPSRLAQQLAEAAA